MSRLGPASRGYSLIEVLVALAISSVCLAVAYGSVIVQTRRHAAQASVAEALHAARAAFGVLTQQIANAGFAVPKVTNPSAVTSIVTAEPSTLSFWTNAATDHTYLTAPVVAGATALQVLSPRGIRPGRNVYLADESQWALAAVSAVKGTVVQLTGKLTTNLDAGAMVLPAEQVTFTVAKGTLVRNGHPFIPNVTDLTFTYDAKAPDQIRVITVTLTVRSRRRDIGGAQRSVTLAARITPPNLAL